MTHNWGLVELWLGHASVVYALWHYGLLSHSLESNDVRWFPRPRRRQQQPKCCAHWKNCRRLQFVWAPTSERGLVLLPTGECREGPPGCGQGQPKAGQCPRGDMCLQKSSVLFSFYFLTPSLPQQLLIKILLWKLLFTLKCKWLLTTIWVLLIWQGFTF